MYHCNIHFYNIGHSCRAFEIIKETPPLEHFSHKFSESDLLDKELAASADVIFIQLKDITGMDIVRELTTIKREDAELILLADKNDFKRFAGYMSSITDIWTFPLSDEEVRFRFTKWQKTCKMNRDFWETSQYLETTINKIPNLIWYKDKDGVHEKVNDSFCRTVNKTKAQVEGRRHAYIWDVEHDDPACIESENEVMTKRQTCISEETIQAGDGTKLLKTYKSPLYNLDGSVMGTVGVAIDITQERAYEQELIQKNQTLENLFSSMDCGLLCHTLDGSRITNINQVALKILGYESENELMKTGFNMIASSVMEEDAPKLQECIKGLKKEGNSVNVEYRVQHSDGKIIYVMGNIKLIKENGELLYQRLLLDCTTQKLREQMEYTEKEKHYTELIQALGIDYSIVCFFNLNDGMGIPLRIHGDYINMLNTIFNGEISLKESMDNFIQTFVYEEDQDQLRHALSLENLSAELAEKNSYYFGFRIYVDDSMKYFQMKAVRTNKWNDQKKIIIGFRNADEETRKEMKQKLLLEDALLQANKANKAKSVFLSNMSHDIRTPMNAIVGFTNLALSHIDHQEQVEAYLKKIMTSGNHLLSLINDILDMSRIESGKIRLDEKPCSLPDVLHGLRNILQADIHAKQLELYIDTVDVQNEEICCDKLRLNQVLLNLLSNSVKYTPAGGSVRLRITELPGAAEGFANYEFYIKDTGIGMSEEFVSHIFEPFERERNSTISKIQGTGLGMAITKNIIDMMNGTIEIKSKQDAGTEVTVLLTFRLGTSPKPQQTISDLRDCRALVVDDDFNTCDSVSYMLEQFGMRAEWTLSGKEAVLRTHQAVMREDNYSVYIVDWLLPDMNGIEVTRRIRKEVGEDIPVIVLTAYDWSDIEEEAKEAGVTSFCSKPLFQSELRTCLQLAIHPEDATENIVEPEITPIYTGHILLAEDVDLNQEIAAAILGEAGFEVDIAENGQIAIDMLQKAGAGYYQVVLMDIQMPVMDGYEATRVIRAMENKELAAIPILAMSANAFEEDKQEALACGMNGHIAKPINVKTLLNTLGEILS